MASYALDRCKEALTCGICKDTLIDPRTLPCLHQYCLKCLHELVEKGGLKEGGFNCPECRHVCLVPQEGLEKLKVSPTITFLLDAYKDVNPTPNQELNCDVCWEADEKNIPAKIKCLDCNKRFCITCRKTHDSILASHKILTLTDDSASNFQTAVKSIKERTVFCQKHPNKPLELYCKVDKVVLCYLCHTIDHTGHAVEDVNQTAANNIKPIGAVITQGNERVAIYERGIQDTQAYQTQFENKAEDITAQINNDMNNSIQATKKKYTSYKDQVMKKKEAHIKQIMSHLGELELQKAITESHIEKYHTMVEHGHPVEIASMIEHVGTKTKEWSQHPSVDFEKKLDIRFKDGEIKGDNMTFGKVHIKKTPVTVCDPTLVSSSKVHPSNIEGLFVTPNGDYVVTGRGTSNARIYGPSYDLKKDLGYKFEKGTLTNDGDLAFTDRSNTIKLYHSDGTFKKDIVCKGVSSLVGITVNSQGEFIVCDSNNGKVYHIDPETGNKTAETPEGMVLLKPDVITCNSKDIILVNEREPECNIIGMLKDNTIVFRNYNNDAAIVDWCTDECDNIFMVKGCYEAGIISDSNGEFISQTDEHCPLSVAIDNDGHLLTGDCDGVIHTYNYRE